MEAVEEGHDCSYLKTLPKYELKFICESRNLPTSDSRQTLKTTLETSGFVHGFISLPASFSHDYFARLSATTLAFIGRKLLPGARPSAKATIERLRNSYQTAVNAAVRWNQRQEMAWELHTRFGLCKGVADLLRYDGRREESGCVYCLRDPKQPQRLKIGRSSRNLPLARMNQQISHNLEVYEVAFFLRTVSSGLIEALLHKELSEKRVHCDPANDGASEWFLVSVQDAAAAMKKITSALHFYTVCLKL